MRKTDSETGETAERNIAFLKSYTVFNAQQIEGLPEHYYPKAKTVEAAEVMPRIAHAEAFAQATGAKITHGGAKAFYMPSADRVQMPPFESFRDATAYYATLIHELTHWTKHPKRLDRDFGRKRFGDQGYAMEELVAELGAAFLCADLDLSPEPRPDHASYIASWLKVLREDKRAIFTAASHAQRAADYLHGLQPGAAALEEPEAA
jgi:antirestriction protein ArdC